MRNPLNRRLKRELRTDLGKYLAIFLFMTLMIGFVSGAVVAGDSMIKAYDETFEKYNIEDGNFELKEKADDALIHTLDQAHVTIYENAYVDEAVIKEGDKKTESTLRIFQIRDKVNLVCLMSGELPTGSDEIAIDRLYAQNQKIKVGDILTVGGKKLKVTGYVALSDYSCMFSNNTDSMFDATKFGVAVMTEDGQKAYFDGKVHYSYSWVYDSKTKNDKEEREKSETFLKVLSQNTQMEQYTPEYLNQAIHFAGDDLGRDKIFFIVLLYMLIIIIAFIFAITTKSTISKEANVIGTLRASGYSKGEIVRHYMLMPLLVTALAAVLGNVLGYTVFKVSVANLYYHSYSLTTYRTIWNGNAFFLTTVIPFILVLVVNYVTIRRKMSLSPLRFLRKDLSNSKRKKAIRLPKWKFFNRFRMRILIQNLSGYLTLLVGICFANVLLMFGLMMTPLLTHFQDEILKNQIAKYQYVLMEPIETIEETAEKYAVLSLETNFKEYKEEGVSVYGINKDSQYIQTEISEGEVYISDGFAAKYRLKKGDKLTLKNSYQEREYTFLISGIYDYPASLCVFINRQDFNEKFDYSADYYNGYFAENEIKDIDKKKIKNTVTTKDLTKTARQLKDSIGSIFFLLNVVSVVLYMILIYILAKVVLERNITSISMVKILGYKNQEIRALYLTATAIAVVVCLIVSIPVADLIIQSIYNPMMREAYTGWLTYYIAPKVYIEMFLLGIAGYFIIEAVLYRKVKRIPMDEALKNV